METKRSSTSSACWPRGRMRKKDMPVTAEEVKTAMLRALARDFGKRFLDPRVAQRSIEAAVSELMFEEFELFATKQPKR